jgi:anti-sigma factor RsiW
MKECWSEGELRAYIDRELPADQIPRVAAHLEACSECGDLWAELAGRAGRVSALLSELGEPVTATAARPKPRPIRPSWRWAGAAAALAAGIMVGLTALPRRAPQVAQAPPALPIVTQSTAPLVEREPASETAHTAVARSGGPAKAASLRPAARPRSAAVQNANPFLALDDDPIESGVVWRVELGPREVPAEVIVDHDGRPRAIRLVNLKSNH